MSVARNIETIRTEMIARMAPLDEWTIEPVHVMGNEDMIVGVVRVRGRRRGRQIETTGAHAFRFDAEGRVVETWGFTAKQDELDDFFRA